MVPLNKFEFEKGDTLVYGKLIQSIFELYNRLFLKTNCIYKHDSNCNEYNIILWDKQ
jgi:hypothetical protein